MAEEIKKDELAVEKAPAKKTTKKAAAPKAEGEKKAPAKKATKKAAPKAEEKVEAPAKKAKAATTGVTVKLVKSLVGRIQNQKDCAAALGLKKVGDVTVQPDNAATKGKIAKISHLVEVTK